MRLAIRFEAAKAEDDPKQATRVAAIDTASEAAGGDTHFRAELRSRVMGPKPAVVTPPAPSPAPQEHKQPASLVDSPTTYGRTHDPKTSAYSLPSSHTYGGGMDGGGAGDIWDEGRTGLDRWRDNEGSNRTGLVGRSRDIDEEGALHTGTGEHQDFGHGTVTYPGRLNPSVARAYGLKEIPSDARREEVMSSAHALATEGWAVGGRRATDQEVVDLSVEREKHQRRKPGGEELSSGELEEATRRGEKRAEGTISRRHFELKRGVGHHIRYHGVHMDEGEFTAELKRRLIGGRHTTAPQADTIPKQITTSAGHQQTVHVKRSDHTPEPESVPIQNRFPDGHAEAFKRPGEREGGMSGPDEIRDHLDHAHKYTDPAGHTYEDVRPVHTIHDAREIAAPGARLALPRTRHRGGGGWFHITKLAEEAQAPGGGPHGQHIKYTTASGDTGYASSIDQAHDRIKSHMSSGADQAFDAEAAAPSRDALEAYNAPTEEARKRRQDHREQTESARLAYNAASRTRGAPGHSTETERAAKEHYLAWNRITSDLKPSHGAFGDPTGDGGTPENIAAANASQKRLEALLSKRLNPLRIQTSHSLWESDRWIDANEARRRAETKTAPEAAPEAGLTPAGDEWPKGRPAQTMAEWEGLPGGRTTPKVGETEQEPEPTPPPAPSPTVNEPAAPEDLPPAKKPEVGTSHHGVHEEHTHNGQWRYTGHNYEEGASHTDNNAKLEAKLIDAGLGGSSVVHNDWFRRDGTKVGEHRSHIKVNDAPFQVYSDRAIEHFKEHGDHAPLPEAWTDHDLYTPKAMEFRGHLDDLAKSFQRNYGSPHGEEGGGQRITHSFDRSSLLGRDKTGGRSGLPHEWGTVPKPLIHKDHAPAPEEPAAAEKPALEAPTPAPEPTPAKPEPTPAKPEQKRESPAVMAADFDPKTGEAPTAQHAQALQLQLKAGATVSDIMASHGVTHDVAEKIVEANRPRDNFFASGSNASREIHGWTDLGVNTGFSAAEVNDKQIERGLYGALDRAHAEGRSVFVDSGAFKEVGFSDGVPFDKEPISDDEWERRLGVYGSIADKFGERAHLVLPDKLADQEETLARMRKYKPHIDGLRSKGATLLAPIQSGPGSSMTLEQFDDAVSEAIGTSDYVRAFPMWAPGNGYKTRTPLEDFERFLRDRQPKRIHLLGVSAAAKRWNTRGKNGEIPIKEIIDRASPDTKYTHDAVRHGSASHRDRKLGKAEARVRRALAETAFGQPLPGAPDYTDHIYSPSGWLPEGRRGGVWDEFHSHTGQLTAEQEKSRERFVKDPDGWIADDENEWATSYPYGPLDQAWERRLAEKKGIGTSAVRRNAIPEAFGSEFGNAEASIFHAGDTEPGGEFRLGEDAPTPAPTPPPKGRQLSLGLMDDLAGGSPAEKDKAAQGVYDQSQELAPGASVQAAKEIVRHHAAGGEIDSDFVEQLRLDGGLKDKKSSEQHAGPESLSDKELLALPLDDDAAQREIHDRANKILDGIHQPYSRGVLIEHAHAGGLSRDTKAKLRKDGKVGSGPRKAPPPSAPDLFEQYGRMGAPPTDDPTRPYGAFGGVTPYASARSMLENAKRVWGDAELGSIHQNYHDNWWDLDVAKRRLEKAKAAHAEAEKSGNAASVLATKPELESADNAFDEFKDIEDEYRDLVDHVGVPFYGADAEEYTQSEREDILERLIELSKELRPDSATGEATGIPVPTRRMGRRDDTRVPLFDPESMRGERVRKNPIPPGIPGAFSVDELPANEREWVKDDLAPMTIHAMASAIAASSSFGPGSAAAQRLRAAIGEEEAAQGEFDKKRLETAQSELGSATEEAEATGHQERLARARKEVSDAKKALKQRSKITLHNITKEEAEAFIAEHHSHLPKITAQALIYAIGAKVDGRLVAVSTAGRPTAGFGARVDKETGEKESGGRQVVGEDGKSRPIEQSEILELTRVASDGTTPGAASKLVSRWLTLGMTPGSGANGRDPHLPAKLMTTYTGTGEDGTRQPGHPYLGARSHPAGLVPTHVIRGGKLTGKRVGRDTPAADVSAGDRVGWEAGPAKRAAVWHEILPAGAERTGLDGKGVPVRNADLVLIGCTAGKHGTKTAIQASQHAKGGDVDSMRESAGPAGGKSGKHYLHKISLAAIGDDRLKGVEPATGKHKDRPAIINHEGEVVHGIERIAAARAEGKATFPAYMPTGLLHGRSGDGGLIPEDDPVPLKDMYKSPMWQNRRGYAEAREERHGVPWAVISAHPDIAVADKDSQHRRYNATTDELKASRSDESTHELLDSAPGGNRKNPGQGRTEWRQRARQSIIDRLWDGKEPPAWAAKKRIELIAGAPYARLLAEAVHGLPVQIIRPTAHLRQGEGKSWLKEQTSKLVGDEAKPGKPPQQVGVRFGPAGSSGRLQAIDEAEARGGQTGFTAELKERVAEEQKPDGREQDKVLLHKYHSGTPDEQREAAREVYARAQELVPGVRTQEAAAVVSQSAHGDGITPEYVESLQRENRIHRQKPEEGKRKKPAPPAEGFQVDDKIEAAKKKIEALQRKRGKNDDPGWHEHVDAQLSKERGMLGWLEREKIQREQNKDAPRRARAWADRFVRTLKQDPKAPSGVKVWQKTGHAPRIYFPGEIGYASVSNDGTINTVSRGKQTLGMGGLWPSWRGAWDRALSAHRADHSDPLKDALHPLRGGVEDPKPAVSEPERPGPEFRLRAKGKWQQELARELLDHVEDPLKPRTSPIFRVDGSHLVVSEADREAFFDGLTSLSNSYDEQLSRKVGEGSHGEGRKHLRSLQKAADALSSKLAASTPAPGPKEEAKPAEAEKPAGGLESGPPEPAYERKMESLPVIRREDWPGGAAVNFLQSPFPRFAGRYPHVLPPDIRAAAIEQVHLADVRSSQSEVTDVGLRKYQDGFGTHVHADGAGGYERQDLPLLVALADGTFAIQDGHHRLVALHLRGKTSAQARVVRLEDPKPPAAKPAPAPPPKEEAKPEPKAKPEPRASTPTAAVIYGAYHRPVSSSTVPGGYSGIGTHPGFAHGTVTYPQALDPDEAKRMSLREIPSPERKEEVIQEALADMVEDRADNLELFDDDPTYFESMVGYAIDDNNVHMDRKELAAEVAKRLRAAVLSETKAKPAKSRKVGIRKKRPGPTDREPFLSQAEDLIKPGVLLAGAGKKVAIGKIRRQIRKAGGDHPETEAILAKLEGGS